MQKLLSKEMAKEICMTVTRWSHNLLLGDSKGELTSVTLIKQKIPSLVVIKSISHMIKLL